MITNLTLGQVRTAHRRVLKKMGKEYLTPDVWYRDDKDRPLCQLGHIFAELELDLSLISDELNGQTIHGDLGEIILASLEVVFTPQARRYLWRLQDATDSGAPWGEAYDALNEEE